MDYISVIREAKAAHPDGFSFWQLGTANEDLFKITSVAMAEHPLGLSVNQIVRNLGYASLDELKFKLKDHSHIAVWKNGHLGWGLYYQGVCCVKSAAELYDLFLRNSEHDYLGRRISTGHRVYCFWGSQFLTAAMVGLSNR